MAAKHIVEHAKRCRRAGYPENIIEDYIREGFRRFKGIAREVRAGRRPWHRSRAWRIAHPNPARKKIRGVPQGVPGHKYVVRIPFRGPAFKRRIKAALRRADLQEFHVMESAGTQLGRLLCPSRIDGPPACNRQCWFCAGREDDARHRQVCKRSMVIYRAKCMNCPANQRSMYVGQTTRRFSKRCKEHLDKCRDENFMANANAQIANVNANNYNNNTLPSAVAMHHHEHHHGLEPNFEFDIVGQADNVNGLDALEAAHQVYGGELGMVYDMNVQVVQGPH